MDAGEGDAGEGDSMYTYETDEQETFDGELSGQGNPGDCGDGDTSGVEPGLGIDDPVSVARVVKETLGEGIDLVYGSVYLLPVKMSDNLLNNSNNTFNFFKFVFKFQNNVSMR